MSQNNDCCVVTRHVSLEKVRRSHCPVRNDAYAFLKRLIPDGQKNDWRGFVVRGRNCKVSQSCGPHLIINGDFPTSRFISVEFVCSITQFLPWLDDWTGVVSRSPFFLHGTLVTVLENGNQGPSREAILPKVCLIGASVDDSGLVLKISQNIQQLVQQPVPFHNCGDDIANDEANNTTLSFSIKDYYLGEPRLHTVIGFTETYL